MRDMPQGFQGLQVPVPDDDFDRAPTTNLVCRAASNPAPAGIQQMDTCAGDSSQRHLQNLSQYISRETSNKSAGSSSLVHEVQTPTQEHTFATPHHSAVDGSSLGAPGPEVVKIQGGGATRPPRSGHKGKAAMQSKFASTTECILQNLTMTVGNPSARCYANAPWRAFTWTCALLQETNAQPWGNLQLAVQESLELAEAVDIRELPGLHPLWAKHDLNIQGDANHFVNTLWNHSQTRAFHYRFAEIQTGGYLKDHIQQPILVDFPDDWPENTSLQDLYNGWANTGLGQFLLDDKPVLIFHITRNTCVEGIMTKHAKILNPYGTFTVPRPLDGFARESAEFVPAALICHRGPSHNTGHYFAILIYRDLMWLADDGKPPVHLEHLTPLLASQVTQIWTVHIDTFRTTQQVVRSLPPPEEPDYDPPLHPSPEKRPRLEQEHSQLHFANITTFGKQFLDWFWARQSEVHIFVETHLDPQRHQEICQYFSIRGRVAFGAPAQVNQEGTGNSGGILILGDQASGLTPLAAYTQQGCGFQAFLWQATECTILVAGVYMKTGEGLQTDTNATILAKLLALVEATKHPYILLGDWQNSPDSFTSTVLPSKFHFDVKAPDHSILSGNVLDYALLHNTLAPTTALTTDWAVPWRPHALITLHLNIEAATKEYRQIQYYPPLVATPDIDFRPWTSYQSQAYEIELYGIPPNEQAQKWADWISCTEQYLLQEHPWAAQGRGASLKVSIKPLVSTQISTTWKKGKPAFWEQLKARFQLAMKQPATVQTGPLQDVPKHWVGPPTWRQFFDTSHHWHRYRDTHAAELVLHTIAHQLREAQQAANDEAHLQYKDWLKQGEAKGLRGLFRSLKSSELAWERPYRNLPPDERMTQRLQDWGKLWQIRQTEQPHERPSLQTQARQQAQQLEPLTIGNLASVLKHLPDKACGPDAVSAQLLRTAPPLALQPLLKLFQDMEHQAQLPTQQQMHMVIMLPKTSTKERPITLTSLLYRVWCRLRKPVLDQWQKQLPPTMQHDRARPGAQVLQVALERLLRQEVHKANGCHGVTCLMDMSTFYDTVNLIRLQQEALRLDYPPLMLELATQLYTGPKPSLRNRK